MTDPDSLREKAELALTTLGARPELLAERNLPSFPDASELVIAHVSASGREYELVPKAAAQWIKLRSAAINDGVTVLVLSGYRGFDRQFELINSKVEAGELINEILAVMAPPGCSEHHTGRAVDVGTPGCESLSETFAETAAFRWLAVNAAEYEFRLSFPPNNRWGYQYEPWHWCYHNE